jgi:tRNA A-37 threonylcarbamoyl transferase component Bud32
MIHEVAGIARVMHRAGLHHQDLYLTHFLLREDDDLRHGLHLIDLGRARCRKRLSTRWIVKDLAQLNYSAHLLTPSQRRRFLEAYLDRPLDRGDRPFVERILRKTRAISRHSERNGL